MCLPARLRDLGRHTGKLVLAAGGEHELAAQGAKRNRAPAPERARRPGDDRDLAADVEERERMAQRFGDHCGSKLQSLPGLTRQSIVFEKCLSSCEEMDPRVKPAGD